MHIIITLTFILALLIKALSDKNDAEYVQYKAEQLNMCPYMYNQG